MISLPNWFSPIIILFQFLLNSIITQISINTNAQKQKRNKTILPFVTIKLLSLWAAKYLNCVDVY